jgi:hypothetical protein
MYIYTGFRVLAKYVLSVFFGDDKQTQRKKKEPDVGHFFYFYKIILLFMMYTLLGPFQTLPKTGPTVFGNDAFPSRS